MPTSPTAGQAPPCLPSGCSCEYKAPFRLNNQSVTPHLLPLLLSLCASLSSTGSLYLPRERERNRRFRLPTQCPALRPTNKLLNFAFGQIRRRQTNRRDSQSFRADLLIRRNRPRYRQRFFGLRSRELRKLFARLLCATFKRLLLLRLLFVCVGNAKNLGFQSCFCIMESW